MRVRVRLPEAFRLYPSVGLRRRNAGMPEQLLDGSQVRTALQEVRGKRMTKGVRRHAAGHRGLARPGGQAPANVACREAFAGLRDEQRGLDRLALAGEQ